MQAYQAWVATQPHSISQEYRRAEVSSEVNPKLDPKQFAEIIIWLAKLGAPPSLREDKS